MESSDRGGSPPAGASGGVATTDGRGAAQLSVEQRGRLRAEQVRLLYANLPSGLAAGFLNACILVFVLWDVIAHPVLLGWLGAVGALTAARAILFGAYRRAQVDVVDATRWGIWFTIGTALSGISWGVVAVILFPADLSHQIFVIFVLAGMTAGAVVILSALIEVGLLFVVLTLTPITVRLLVDPHDIHFAMGAMSVLFMGLMIITTRRIYRTTLDSLRLRFENTDLVARLAREKEAMEQLNIELKREIGERERVEAGLRESEGRIRAVVENVPDGIVTFADDGRIETVNPAAERVFGYAAAELVGKPFTELLPQAERVEYENYLLSRARDPDDPGHAVGFGIETTGQRRDATRFPMELGVSDMRLGQRRRFIGIVRDMTERKKVERLKSQFVSAVSHELRTPLTSVLGSLGLLSEGIAGELSERGKSLLGIAHSNVERLARLISDILEMDDIQSGSLRLNLKPVDLAELVGRAVERARPQAAAIDVEIRLRSEVDSVMVHADAERLVHVMGHLLSNALKYSPGGGVVDVAVTRRGPRLRVAVADRGPGIPETFRAHLFEPFTQADDAKNQRGGGAGLGLAIAKAVIERHGGRIGFESGDAGAYFFFELAEWQQQPQQVSAGLGKA